MTQILILGDGSAWGIRLAYPEQPRPEGLAQALVIARDFLAGDSCTLILGDNVFFGQGLGGMLQNAIRRLDGATLFTYAVAEPQRYGVLTFDSDERPEAIVEKPKEPVSRWAVTGIYVYDGQAPDRAAAQTPSDRGELEITDLNTSYLERGRLSAVRLGRGFAWFDTGTHDDLLAAGDFVRTVEARQSLKIACPKEIAWHNT